MSKELHLSRQKLFRYLRKLDDFGLIDLLPGEKVKIPSTGPVLWRREGSFMPIPMRRWSKAILEDVMTKSAKDRHFALRHWRLTRSSHRELLKSLEDLNNEFANRSMRESKAHPKSDLLSVALMTASTPENLVRLDRSIATSADER